MMASTPLRLDRRDLHRGRGQSEGSGDTGAAAAAAERAARSQIVAQLTRRRPRWSAHCHHPASGTTEGLASLEETTLSTSAAPGALLFTVMVPGRTWSTAERGGATHCHWTRSLPPTNRSGFSPPRDTNLRLLQVNRPFPCCTHAVFDCCVRICSQPRVQSALTSPSPRMRRQCQCCCLPRIFRAWMLLR